MTNPIQTFDDAAARLGVTQDAERAVARWSRVSHLPGLIKTLGSMELPASLVEPAREALAEATLTDMMSFRFVFGMVGVLAHDGSEASHDVIRGFAARSAAALAGDPVLDAPEMVARVVSAVGRGQATTRLVDDLRQQRHGADPANEARRWGAQHAPKLTGDWTVTIWIGEGVPKEWFGDMQEGPQVCVRVRPEHRPDWELTLLGDPTDHRRHHNLGGTVTQDDFGLPPLAHLTDVPAWLPRAAEVLRVSWSFDHAIVDAGRHRSIVTPVREWLKG